MNEQLRSILDLGPVIVFFVSYFVAGKLFPPAEVGHASQPAIMWSTGLFMGATLISLAVSYVMERKVHLVPVITAVVVLLFGGLTIALKDERFIKIKPTIIYAVLAAILIAGYAMRKPFIRHIFGKKLQLTDHGWRVLTLRFGLFFLFAAVLNEVVWRNFSFDFWITYKVWGFMVIMFVFTAWQVMFVTRYQVKNEEPDKRSVP